MSYLLYQLTNAWQVDQAIVSEESKLVVLRFGHNEHPDCLIMDDILSSIAERIKLFAAIYLVDTRQVPDFNDMYELIDPFCIMVFFRNQHIKIDLGTGNNNKINFVINDKQELIDILELCYRGAYKGKGLVVSNKDYSSKFEY
eukprot:NODE_632_length_5775_cov_0.216702.p4 type:complete len:143 gc:universal NODE_632_length_5775_cov_0.216702:4087-4515(+)